MIDLESLIILLNIGQIILHSIQVPSNDFCYAGEEVEAVYNATPLNRDGIS